MGDLFCPSTEDFRTKVCWYSGNVFAPPYFSGSDVWKSLPSTWRVLFLVEKRKLLNALDAAHYCSERF